MGLIAVCYWHALGTQHQHIHPGGESSKQKGSPGLLERGLDVWKLNSLTHGGLRINIATLEENTRESAVGLRFFWAPGMQVS